MLFPLDASGAAVPVSEEEEACGVRLSREKDQSLLFLSRYDSCYAHIEVSDTAFCELALT